jgi:hypothetical protein
MFILRRGGVRVVGWVAIGALLGCSSIRDFEVIGDGPAIANSQEIFYVVVNDSTEIVDYNYLAVPLHYDSYAAWRVPVGTKLHVPVEIVRYLNAHGKRTTMGPADGAPQRDAVVIRYAELWGWDMRSILKKLTIEMALAGSPEKAVVYFEEMSIFNTQPTASSLVPAMMARLFEDR